MVHIWQKSGFRNQKILIRKAIRKVCQNPLPVTECGYGKPLGNKGGNNRAVYSKVKLRGAGLCIVYQLIRQGDIMLVIVIGVREDKEVYKMALKSYSHKGPAGIFPAGPIKAAAKLPQLQYSRRALSETISDFPAYPLALTPKRLFCDPEDSPHARFHIPSKAA